MDDEIIYKPIGIVHTPHKTIEDIPIQPVAAAGVKGEVEIFEVFKEGLRDLDGFSHIYLLYDFHKTKDYSLLVKPFLDDQLRGIFATRAPKRPNRIGLSVLKLIGVEDNKVYVENVDILDGTPVLDIKPYSSIFNAVENERIGWMEKSIDESYKKKSDKRFK